jgi:outer membrane receptor for ferrienterochelin and colicin
VYDLYGGDFILNQGQNRNYRLPLNEKLKVGDEIQYNYKGYVRWGGIFGMAEYEKDGLSAFLNLSTATSAYAYEDFLDQKVIALADTTFRISAGDTVTIGDGSYNINSPEAENFKIDWIIRPSFTVKTGAAYRFDKNHGLFFNVGYLSRPTRYTNVIISNSTNENDAVATEDPQNEIVTSYEVGYSFNSSKFSANVNTYYTNWKNKPLDFLPVVLEDPTDPDSDRMPVNIQGLAARHMGIEIDFAYVITDKLKFEGLASLGDWIWNSADTVLLPDGITTYEFDPTGVHVGDAAQIQLGGLIRYEPIKNLYFKLKTTYFAKNFSNFNPEDLKGATARKESWQIPNYNLVDFHTGYRFNIKKVRTDIRFNVLNILNTRYISDANNNDRFTQSFNDFDAKSAAVFLGQGIRWNTSIQFTF